jgi:hypothetical protein
VDRVAADPPGKILLQIVTINGFVSDSGPRGDIPLMDGQHATDSLKADLNTLRQELTELHAEARTAAAQRRNEGQNDQVGIVLRGQ